MRRAVLAAAVLVVAAFAAGAASQPLDQEMFVEMRDRQCLVDGEDLTEGFVVFAVANASRRPRRFQVARSRTAFVPPNRDTVLRVALAAGTPRYRCEAKGRPRSVHSGVLRVGKPPTPPPAPPQHRIGVRGGEFYDRATGARFVPRGANYIRVAPQTGFDGASFVYHSTFNVGLYDAGRADAALAAMAAHGYNVVRVFLNGACRSGCLSDVATRGLSGAYVANLADFLRRAKSHGIYVVVTTDGIPGATTYGDLNASACCETFSNVNTSYLPIQGVVANADFWRDLVRALVAAHAPLDAVFAWALRNEAFYSSEFTPLNLASGSVRIANGLTYDLADPASRAAMLEDGLVHWVDRVAAAIREVDPTALVTIGFFHPHGPNPSRPNDRRVVPLPGAIFARSTVDFGDVHPYPNVDLTLPQFMTNYGITGGESKPLLMGEFGAFRFAFGDAADASYRLQAWQAESCRYGFDGWLLWTWDTDEQPELFNARSDGGAIERGLAPRVRPDPCDRPQGRHNLALRRPASAFATFDGSPDFAVDGNSHTAWRAGRFGPGWIEINLERPSAVERIRLLVDQHPPGTTVHRVHGRGDNDGYRLLHEFTGFTESGRWLEHTLATPATGIRWLRVETVVSPSWLAWREIQILGTD